MKILSLRKSKKVLLGVYHLWLKKKKKLLPAQAGEIRRDMEALQEQILQKKPEQASSLAFKCHEYESGLLKKSGWEKTRDFFVAIAFALAVALVIRQMWFELYEIPSGSMRPTFKERDRLVVSKTTFGVDVPFTTKHFYFDPDLVKRSGIFIFSVENMDVHDPDTLYFFLFPGKKQFVKRMMGRPGDTVYFYGGQMYGINEQGNDISQELQPKILSKINHVPFLRFDGSVSLAEPYRTPIGNGYRMAILHQMNEPIARLSVTGNNRLEGEMLYTPRISHSSTSKVKNYSDLWGIGNYATARIVKKEEIRSFAEKENLALDETPLYLELKHHPSLDHLQLGRDLAGRLMPQFVLNTSILPLGEDHLREIFNNISTERFVIKNGFAMAWRIGKSHRLPSHLLTKFEGVPDGTYEFFDGQGYQVKWGGITKKLNSDHPLQKFSPGRVRKLYNYGVEFDKRHVMQTNFDTGRFVYFKDGDLLVLGAPIFKKGEKALSDFISREQSRVAAANLQNPYSPFLDEGAPYNEDGEIDVEKIRNFGLLIPPKSYLALGDNFSMSGDSRVFGFVPQGNIRGAPSWIFWPPGDRLGPPNQPFYPGLTFPSLVVWSLALIGFLCWFIYHRKFYRLPLNFDR